MADRQRRMLIDDARKRIFLETLAKTGSRRDAAIAASPHALGGAESSFRELARRDPEFASAVQNAVDNFIGRAEAAVAERAFTPGVRESFDENGNVRSREVSWRDANVMVLRLLAKNDPAWRENRKVEVDGRIEHAQADNGNSYRIAAADVLALAPEDRRSMIELLGKVEENRLAAEGGREHGQLEVIEQPRGLLENAHRPGHGIGGGEGGVLPDSARAGVGGSGGSAPASGEHERVD